MSVYEPEFYEEKKKSGTYLRIVETYRHDGKIRHRTLHSLGKKEDYSDEQLMRIAEKLVGLAGRKIEHITVDEILSKYADLFEVEHTFRALKSQLQIRPVFHWTDKRIQGHICMCFLAYTFFNNIRNITQLQYRQIVKAIDKMQVSHIEDKRSSSRLFLRSSITEDQLTIINKLKLKKPNDTTLELSVNQLFTK